MRLVVRSEGTFVVFNTAAVGCLMLAIFEKEYVQDGWLYAFYALMGVAT
jgi:hypothetical protein